MSSLAGSDWRKPQVEEALGPCRDTTFGETSMVTRTDRFLEHKDVQTMRECTGQHALALARDKVSSKAGERCDWEDC